MEVELFVKNEHISDQDQYNYYLVSMVVTLSHFSFNPYKELSPAPLALVDGLGLKTNDHRVKRGRGGFRGSMAYRRQRVKV